MGLFTQLDSSLSSAPRKSEAAYKSISEVSDILGVPQHVLRFWETHFPQLSPSRMRGSRRYYRPEDVAVLQNIKTLLYTKGYTIKGARKLLSSKNIVVDDIEPAPEPQAFHPDATAEDSADIHMLINELRVLKSMIKTIL